jgi:hypothetical protein
MTHPLRWIVLRLRRRGARPGPDDAETPTTGLTCCPACHSTMVVPDAADDVGHAWYLRLRCGECGRQRLVLVDGDRLRLYKLELDRLEDELLNSMAALRRDGGDGATALDEAMTAELIERDRTP